MNIEYLDNIDFEPLIMMVETSLPCKDFGNSVVMSIRDWEDHRPQSCTCSSKSLEIILFDFNKHSCKLGLEWACLDVCIPSLAKWISERFENVTALYIGEKHIPSSSKSYAYISIFDQVKENIVTTAASTSGYSCFVDYDELESFIFVKDLETFDSGRVIKVGRYFSQSISHDLTIWRNLCDDILEIYFFENGTYVGFVSTVNTKIDESLFKKARTDFPKKMASMFQAKRPKSKWELHHGIAAYSKYNIESIGVNYSEIINGKFGFGREKSNYIHYDFT